MTRKKYSTFLIHVHTLIDCEKWYRVNNTFINNFLRALWEMLSRPFAFSLYERSPGTPVTQSEDRDKCNWFSLYVQMYYTCTCTLSEENSSAREADILHMKWLCRPQCSVLVRMLFALDKRIVRDPLSSVSVINWSAKLLIQLFHGKCLEFNSCVKVPRCAVSYRIHFAFFQLLTKYKHYKIETHWIIYFQKKCIFINIHNIYFCESQLLFYCI